ncbi:MAG: CoA transferase, partial [Actinobacteria bacterium]|nr:CoA transferase [Actinomycetota bacterium]NIU71152.1 CoA transferase [Actinomycetota bacterium]NIW33108.1 CoA transferase [Actinomycetota bacterium]NIX25255.1 CoA transferase [Actinomycetota bacterium]
MAALDVLSGDGPLEGVVVIEAGTIISSGTLGRLLADFGATVIKVEHPEAGDPLRDLKPRK